MANKLNPGQNGICRRYHGFLDANTLHLQSHLQSGSSCAKAYPLPHLFSCHLTHPPLAPTTRSPKQPPPREHLLTVDSKEHRSLKVECAHRTSPPVGSRVIPEPGCVGLACIASLHYWRTKFIANPGFSSGSSIGPFKTLVCANVGNAALWTAPNPVSAGNTKRQLLTPCLQLRFGYPMCGAH